MSERSEAVALGRVCVFCGSSTGVDPVYAEAAARLGRMLAERGIGLVYGGGRVGLMGVLADVALAAGAEVTGVIPRTLQEREVGHDGVTRLHVVESMHERKALMAELSDAFIALPGGLGTMEELFEVWTWGQLGLHRKPYGVLNVAGYFQPLIAFLDHMVVEGFLPEAHRALVLVDASPASLLDRLAAYEPPRARQWVSLEET